MGWRTFPCPGSSPGWRYTPEGYVETTDRGVAKLPAWPRDIEQWRSLITRSAAKYGIPSAWIAAIMAGETGGRPGLCARLADGTCAQNEGAGLMAILPSTATGLAGRKVTSEELIADHELSIDLGAKYLLQNLSDPKTGGDFPGGDFVYAAVSYNAGSVRCGTGHIWRPAGSSEPRTACPPSPWGIVQGCVAGPGGTPVLADYPRHAILAANAAIDKGFDGGGAGPMIASTSGEIPGWLIFAAGATAGYFAMRRFGSAARR